MPPCPDGPGAANPLVLDKADRVANVARVRAHHDDDVRRDEIKDGVAILEDLTLTGVRCTSACHLDK
jgi:hypothetical protein